MYLVNIILNKINLRSKKSTVLSHIHVKIYKSQIHIIHGRRGIAEGHRNGAVLVKGFKSPASHRELVLEIMQHAEYNNDVIQNFKRVDFQMFQYKII